MYRYRKDRDSAKKRRKNHNWQFDWFFWAGHLRDLEKYR